MANKHYTLAQLAEKFSVQVVGDADCEISAVADIQSATAGSITFLSNPRFKHHLQSSQASAIIISEAMLEDCSLPALVTSNPYLLYAKVSSLLNPDEDLALAAMIHPSAVIAGTAKVDPSAHIAANVVIEDDVVIGANSYIGPCCVIKRRARIGQASKLSANITVCTDCEIGDRAIIHPAVVIGSDGFGFANEKGEWFKIPQLGKVVIGDDVEIGAGVAIDRGAINNTVIENGVKLDNQIHVAHNVSIGAHTAMAAQSGIAGSTSIGQYCAIGGSTGILGHLKIADGTQLHAFSQVSQSIKEPGSYASGVPLEPTVQWRRNWARMKQLDEMAKRLKQLEKLLLEKTDKGEPS